MKKIVYKYIPKELLDRPKSGFSIPIEEWFKGDMKHYLYDLINEEQIAKHNLINAQKAISIRDEFIAGKNKHERQVIQVWLLLIFQMWWNKWM